MKTLLKIKGGEYAVPFARFRERDFSYDRRSTVTIVTDLEYAAVVALFSEPGEWYVLNRNEDSPELDTDIDCTDYDKLLSIKDARTGVLEVVMGKATDSEVLAELLEVLNG